MRNEKIIKTQKAMEYIMYMMVGSYFKDVKCASHTLEKKLFLYYKDIKVDAQYSLEEKCINYTEKVLMKALPEKIWNEEVKAVLKVDDSSLKTVIIFEGKDFSLKLKCDCTNKSNPVISYEMTEDNAPVETYKVKGSFVQADKVA